MATKAYELEMRRRATITHVQNLISAIQEDLDWGIVQGMSEKRKFSLWNRVAHLRDRLGKLEIAEYKRYQKELGRVWAAEYRYYTKEMSRLQEAYVLMHPEDKDHEFTVDEVEAIQAQVACSRPFKTDEF